VSKKLQAKQERRLAEEQRKQAQRRAARRGNLVTLIVAIVVLAVVVGLIWRDRTRTAAPVGGDPAAAGCSEVETPEPGSADHVEPGTPVDYETTPPTSGPHYPSPADPGFYSAPVPEQTLVHNLEHGQIVIWYRPDAPAEIRDQIEALTEQEPIATVAAPYENLPGPYNLALTAWGARQMCGGVSQEVVDDFRARFQGRGPEDVGVPVFTPGGDGQ
jgi:hypothetical protein